MFVARKIIYYLFHYAMAFESVNLIELSVPFQFFCDANLILRYQVWMLCPLFGFRKVGLRNEVVGE